jgi:hypothetical protein
MIDLELLGLLDIDVHCVVTRTHFSNFTIQKINTQSFFTGVSLVLQLSFFDLQLDQLPHRQGFPFLLHLNYVISHESI